MSHGIVQVLEVWTHTYMHMHVYIHMAQYFPLEALLVSYYAALMHLNVMLWGWLRLEYSELCPPANRVECSEMQPCRVGQNANKQRAHRWIQICRYATP